MSTNDKINLQEITRVEFHNDDDELRDCDCCHKAVKATEIHETADFCLFCDNCFTFRGFQCKHCGRDYSNASESKEYENVCEDCEHEVIEEEIATAWESKEDPNKDSWTYGIGRSR
jgi:hypothetical protein